MKNHTILRVTVPILSGRFGALIVVVEAWNFFYILIKVSWVQKSTNGKKIFKGKNRDFGTFFEILNFIFCTKSGSRDCQWASINMSNESPWSTEHFCISEKFKKKYFQPFSKYFFQKCPKITKSKNDKTQYNFSKGVVSRKFICLNLFSVKFCTGL